MPPIQVLPVQTSLHGCIPPRSAKRATQRPDFKARHPATPLRFARPADSRSTLSPLKRLIIAIALLTVATAAKCSDPPPSPLIWRTVNRCPINSLYIVLRMHGRPVDYRQLEQDIPISERGSSLVHLRDSANRYGLNALIVRETPNELPHYDLPVIAHWEEEKESTGHYVVVTAATDTWVEYIDGGTAMINVMPMNEFSKRWTGYAVVFQRRTSWHAVFLSCVGLGVLVILFGILDLRHRTRNRQQKSPVQKA